tara:strand:- start:413 stop:2830 length:2418 start_codon:yes stop_codon:yes gene_type:complete
MKLLVYKIFILISFFGFSQTNYSGKVIDKLTKSPLANVSVYNSTENKLSKTNSDGLFDLVIESNNTEILFYIEGYNLKSVIFSGNKNYSIIELNSQIEKLDEVIVRANKKKVFQIERLKDFEETYVYAGKKNEVILMDLSMANLASNNARQVYSQIPGINIFQNDDAGLQLNIGGRGLNPNRSSNFNTRQNNYDISADALGYPESYYTPANEGLQEIQILRGAASLQYGTQFGGLVNFIMKKPNQEKKLEIITRNTLGTNGLYTNFTSTSYKKNNFSYFGFINYKKGDGFRENSEFNSINYYQNFNFEINEKIKITADLTYLNYLAHQAGGLSDIMFRDNPFQSNRERNWFDINWFLYNLKYIHKVNDGLNLSLNFYGLEAKRNSLGFRTNRVDQIDPGEERDLIKGDFSNYGFEGRILKNYKIKNKKNYLLLGFKIYNSNSMSEQGPGSGNSTADFEFDFNNYPNYVNQSKYRYPNKNFALFGENIFYLNENLSITPGFRYENIVTKNIGFYRRINTDAAGNVIYNERFDENDSRKRSFLLLGLGIEYKVNIDLDLYSNFSQNYRSVTFADISIINPAYAINPNIDDEKGYTFDFGLRGKIKDIMSFDSSLFALIYRDRIGFVQRVFPDGNVKSERGNVGNAQILGFENLIDFNLKKILSLNNNNEMNFFINYSFINSKYLESEEIGIEGKSVEFVPDHNLKTGIKYGFKNLSINFQYLYMSSQFTDSSNAINGNLSGVIGEIPSYRIADLSFSYNAKKISYEFGVNNLLNEKYFTRRATGYPGPGIIPSAPRNYYLTLEYIIK